MKSKLVEKLEQLAKAATQPMGFKAPTVHKGPAMLLIASLPTLDAEALAAASKVRIDAVLLPGAKINKQAKAALQEAKTQLPWGSYLETATPEEVKLLQEKGCDFIIFQPAKAAAAIIQQQDIGKIIQVEPSLPDSVLRTINQMPVDAALLTAGDTPLTVQHVMSCYHLANLLRKPLLAESPLTLTGEEVKALWQAGVNGIVVKLTPGQPWEKLEDLKRGLAALPAGKRERKEVAALLPQLPGTPAPAEEEEEEET